MNKTTTFAVIMTLAVVLCFAASFSFTPMKSLMAADSSSSYKGVLKTRPIWELTHYRTGKSVKWVDADNPRFCIWDNETPEDETDDVVLDKETGLIWERSPDNSYESWYWALGHCYNKMVAYHYGWRLPAIEELASLILNPLPFGHPFINVQLATYWSSSTYEYRNNYARIAEFDDGFVGVSFKTDDRYVWCVRGGRGHLAY